MTRATLLLALVAATALAGDPVQEEADAVEAAVRAGDAAPLRDLAARDHPDPWIIADELIARTRFDAAEAFAKAAPRPDTESLPTYVARRRGAAPGADSRAALANANAALASREWGHALESLPFPEPGEDPLLAVRIHYGRGLALRGLNRLDECGKEFDASARTAHELGWRRREHQALHEAGLAAKDRSDWAVALDRWAACLALCEMRGDRRGMAVTLGNIGNIHCGIGDYARARDYQDRSLTLMEELGDQAGIARTLANIGAIHEMLGEYRQALECQERSLQLQERLGNRVGVARALANIGNIHADLGEYMRALEYQERSLTLMEEVGDRAGIARALANIGVIHERIGDYPRAMDCQQRSLKSMEELGDRAGVATALGNIGVIHEKLGDYARALECQEQSLKFKEAIGDRAAIAATLGNIGVIHGELGDYPRALGYQERSLALREELGDRAGIAATLGDIGNIHADLGDYPRALECQERSRRLEAEIGNRAGTARALGNLGNIHERLGEYARAQEYHERSLELEEELGNRAGVAASLASLGNIHYALGDYPRAMGCQERSLRTMEELGDRAGIARTLGNLGNIHLGLGDCPKALSYQERSLKLEEELGNRAGIARTLANLGIVREGLGEYPRALEYEERALKLMEELGARAWVAATLGDIGNIHYRRGDHARALEYQERSLKLAEEVGVPEVVACSLANLCMTHLALGDPGAAITAGRRAITAVLGLVHGLADDQGARARERWAGLFETGVRASLEQGSPGDAAFFLESGRAGTLLETLGGRERLWATAIPEPLRMEESKARAREAVALKLYQKALESGGDVKALWTEVEASRGSTLDVIARIQREAKAQAALLYPKADSLEEIQKSLRPDEALVLYGPKVALVVTPKDARIVGLGDVEETAGAFQRAIVNPDERGMSAPPHEQLPFLKKKLSGMVVDALGLGDSVKRLLVCPDGVLAYIPFCALTDREVVYVPSGTVYRLLREEESKRGSKVLALGDPKTRADPLPASGAEAKAVGDVVLLQEEATISGLRELLSTQDRWHAVHFACHGMVDPERPVLSALALTPEGDEDGYLRCLDIYRMKIPADLVMLSACETAKGKVYTAEGVMGWTRAFMFAGAPRVVVSLWKVDDEATRALMTAFYENWKTMPAATALRRAQEQVAAQEKWKHPYFWAAWQLWGLGD